MNLRDIEYIIRIAEEKNITKAAAKLFITPSALTQLLFRLEKDLGITLFYRSRSGCIPTKAGEVYLDAARKILYTQREAYNEIRDIADIKNGILSLGFPPERGSSMFLSVYPIFHQLYPEISIQMYEVSVRKQQQMISQGLLDLGFMTLNETQKTNDEHISILKEELLLAVPANHPVCQFAVPSSTGQLPELSLSYLKEEKFALLYKESTMREWIDTHFRKASFTPTVLFETSHIRTILHMIAAGFCCSLVTAYYYQTDLNISYFRLPEHPTWQLMAAYRKGSYLSVPAKEFIRLATEYWKTEHHQLMNSELLHSPF